MIGIKFTDGGYNVLQNHVYCRLEDKITWFGRIGTIPENTKCDEVVMHTQDLRQLKEFIRQRNRGDE